MTPPPRTPPHDLDAEEALLGAMLLSTAGIDTAIAAPVTSADFYNPKHSRLYEAILAVAARNEIADTVTVGSELDRRGTLDLLGGKEGLSRISTAAPLSMNAAAYARTVAEHSHHRRLLAVLSQTTEAIYEGTDPTPLLEQLDAPRVGKPSTWNPIDVAAILAGDLTPPEPTILRREDGRRLLYPGRVHTFQGESESLKTWLALLAVVQELTTGRHVLYLDFEDTPESILGRLLNLGAARDDLLGFFTYLRPGEHLDLAAGHRLEKLLDHLRPSLVVIDGVTEAMSLEGLDLLDNMDVSTWLARLPRRIADLGPAVAMIDHVTKSAENRGRHAIGAQHKLAGIDGVAYNIDAIRPLAHVAPGSLREITGISKITIAKDRPGAVRGYSVANKHAGTLELTAYPDGGITGRIMPATATPEGGFRPTGIMEKITATLERAGTPLTKNALYGAVRGKEKTIALALELLVAEGYVALEEGPRRSQIHRAKKPYRADTDPKNITTTDDDQDDTQTTLPTGEDPNRHADDDF